MASATKSEPNVADGCSNQTRKGPCCESNKNGRRCDQTCIYYDEFPNCGKNSFGGGYYVDILSQWMYPPRSVPLNCPPGMQFLVDLAQLFVEHLDLKNGGYTFDDLNNRYIIRNAALRVVYLAEEGARDICSQTGCGPCRPFDISIMDRYNNEIIHLQRDIACDSCWFPCCMQKLKVFSGGFLIGTVEQCWSIFTYKFDVKNETGEKILKIVGPICTFSTRAVDFKVFSSDEKTVVGKLTKRWNGIESGFHNPEYFEINFQAALDVRTKSILLAACFLLDFMYFEVSQ